MAVSVEADFQADLRRSVIARLTADGCTIDTTLSTDALLWNFLKVQHRRIGRRARRVEWSSHLRAREATLPDDIGSALGRIVIASETGDDLSPFLSRDLASSKAFRRNDMMLNELGMHHFHLGAGTNAKGLASGRDELLFAYVSDDAVHFVDVRDHKSFGDEDSFRIAQESWPHLFEGRRMVGVAHSRELQTLTQEQREELLMQRETLRRKHANVPVAATDGTLFHPPGGGVAPSGVAFMIVPKLDYIMTRVPEAERWCKANGALLADRFEAEHGSRPSAFRLRFEDFDDSGAVIAVDDSLQWRVLCPIGGGYAGGLTAPGRT